MSTPSGQPAAQDVRGFENLQIIAHEKTHRKVLDIFSRFPLRGRLLDIPAGEGALAWQLHPYALIADAVHSVSDLFTDVVVLLGLKIGRKAPDQEQLTSNSMISGKKVSPLNGTTTLANLSGLT